MDGVQHSQLRTYLEALWTDELGTDAGAIDADTNFFEHGADSMNAVRMLVAALDHYDAEIEIEAFLAEPTLGRLELLLIDAVAARSE